MNFQTRILAPAALLLLVNPGSLGLPIPKPFFISAPHSRIPQACDSPTPPHPHHADGHRHTSWPSSDAINNVLGDILDGAADVFTQSHTEDEDEADAQWQDDVGEHWMDEPWEQTEPEIYEEPEPMPGEMVQETPYEDLVDAWNAGEIWGRDLDPLPAASTASSMIPLPLPTVSAAPAVGEAVDANAGGVEEGGEGDKWLLAPRGDGWALVPAAGGRPISDPVSKRNAMERFLAPASGQNGKEKGGLQFLVPASSQNSDHPSVANATVSVTKRNVTEGLLVPASGHNRSEEENLQFLVPASSQNSDSSGENPPVRVFVPANRLRKPPIPGLIYPTNGTMSNTTNSTAPTTPLPTNSTAPNSTTNNTWPGAGLALHHFVASLCKLGHTAACTGLPLEIIECCLEANCLVKCPPEHRVWDPDALGRLGWDRPEEEMVRDEGEMGE